MYKYSRSAQERFFSHPTYAFLFAHFATSPDAVAFAGAKFAENPDARYGRRMGLEIEQLGQEATKQLKMDADARILQRYLLTGTGPQQIV